VLHFMNGRKTGSKEECEAGTFLAGSVQFELWCGLSCCGTTTLNIDNTCGIPGAAAMVSARWTPVAFALEELPNNARFEKCRLCC
jgi:hypothetical protein